MNVGTAEIVDEIEEPKRRKIGGFGGSNSPNGGGRQDPGGGSDGPDGGNKDETVTFEPGKSRIFTAFLLLVVMMTFGGLLAAYIVVATNKALEWHPFELPVQVWISTLIILTSSVTFHFGKIAIDRNDQRNAKRWLIGTTILGATFISSQLLVWLELTARGLYMEGNPYAGFFYVLTFVHAIHVLGGITALGSIVLRVWITPKNESEVAKSQTIAQVVGWYWHFMACLWIVIVFLLGFWK